MIESLHSPHIGRVKALNSSRGNKERAERAEFIAEGLQCAREALAGRKGPVVKTIYLTQSGKDRLEQAGVDAAGSEVVMVSEPVMSAMSETITPQGIICICSLARSNFEELILNGRSRLIYLHEIQDPGNAGTILRSAYAMGVDAVIASPGSVDMYSPKVVRATAGSLWHINLYTGISLNQVTTQFPSINKVALNAHGEKSLLDLDISGDSLAIFGNEARGIDAFLDSEITQVKIPMSGSAESLNLSAAAAIVIFHLANS